MSRGNHSFKFGGEVSYEKIVHDTLLDNYGVFAFNGSKTGNAYADFLLGLPATMTQDAPVRKTDNGAYISLFAQDDYRIHPRRDAEPRPALRPAVPLHRSAEPQARVRARRAVAGVADGAGSACSSPATPASAAASSRPTTTTSRRASGSPGIRRGDGRMSVRAARGRLLRQHHRQRVEHDGRQPALHGAAAVPDREDAVRSVRQPARAASVRSRSSTIRRARDSRCRRRCSARRSISCGRTRTR